MAVIHAESSPIPPMSSSLPRRRFLAGLPALGLMPHAVAAQGTEPLQHIIFGSCLDTHEHPMLERTLTLPRDLFFFMGDHVYAGGRQAGGAIVRHDPQASSSADMAKTR